MPLRVDFSEQADRQIKQETELDSTLPLEQDYGATKPTTKEF